MKERLFAGDAVSNGADRETRGLVGDMRGRFSHVCTRIIGGSAVAVSLLAGSATVSGCDGCSSESDSVSDANVVEDSTTARLFKILGLSDKNNNGAIDKKGWPWSSNEGYESKSMVDLNSDDKIDAKEALYRLFSQYNSHHVTASAPDPTEFALHEIANGSAGMESSLMELFDIAHTFDDQSRGKLLESVFYAGLMKRDIKIFETAFNLSKMPSATLQTDKLLQDLFTDRKLTEFIGFSGGKDGKNAGKILAFVNDELMPWLKSVNLNHGSDNIKLASLWLRTLADYNEARGRVWWPDDVKRVHDRHSRGGLHVNPNGAGTFHPPEDDYHSAPPPFSLPPSSPGGYR